MKAHIVLAHPEAKFFNAHLAATTQKVLGAAGWLTTLDNVKGLSHI